MQAVHWFDIAVTALLIALCWAVQIGITVVAAFVIGGIIRAAEQLIRKKRVNLLPRALVMLVLIVAILAALTAEPPVICAEEHREAVGEELVQSVRSVSRGLYSANIPLVPAWVRITEVDGYTLNGQRGWEADFTIHYLWFGTVELEYDSLDGYNVTKPLTGW